MAKSFLENLRNAPADAMKEIKGLMSSEKKPKSEATEAARAARQGEIARAAEADRQRSMQLAEQKRAEIDAFFGSPSPSERGARLAPVRESGPAQPVSLDRARLLSRRDMLMNARNGMDADRRKATDAEIARIDQDLKKAA